MKQEAGGALRFDRAEDLLFCVTTKPVEHTAPEAGPGILAGLDVGEEVAACSVENQGGGSFRGRV